MNEATVLLTNLEARRTAGQTRSLDGMWNAIIDPYESGYIGITGDRNRAGYFRDFKPRHAGDRVEYDFDTSMELAVPGDWNTQHAELLYYEGALWYRRTFDGADETGRSFLYFGASNHTTRVFVDGEELALHEGGFGPFAVEVTGRVGPGEHSLVVMVDNRRDPKRIPAMRTDWWNFGGLHRSVDLVNVPDAFIADAWITMAPDGSLIGEVVIDGDTGAAPAVATVDIPETGLSVTAMSGERFTVSADEAARLERWHPGAPRLYDVVFSVAGDRITDQVGFRTVEVTPERVVVNGEPVFLKGIAMHAEGPTGGKRASGADDAATLLQWAQDLGANFVRLSHYQHDEAMVREADRRGLLAWCELPVYWGIDFADDDVLANAVDQCDEMVVRDRNRASVILWSVANETLPGDDRNRFLKALADRCRELDPTRLVTAALLTLPSGGTESHIDDPLGEHVDVIGINQYYAWYYGSREQLRSLEWTSEFDKPVFFSELGAGAKYGNHGTEDEIWTEEFQAAVYEAQLEMISRQPMCCGLSPWILKDFRTPMRVLPGIQDGYNRKGVVSEEGERKLAFDVLRDWYASLG